MMRAQSSRRLAGSLTIALLTVAAAVLPGAAVAMSGSGELSPRLAKLVAPALRGAPPARQARALGLAPGGLARDGERVLVNIRFDRGALAARDALRRVGASTVAASSRYQALTVVVAPADLRALARVPGIEGVAPVHAPVAAATCPAGAVVSEGDAQLRADEARDLPPGPLEFNGAGVDVGILSDSFDQATEASDGSGPIATHASEDVASGDLPGANGCTDASLAPVAVLSQMNDPSRASDEGRAMLQIVHDLAPGADLGFASAFNGELAFADAIHDLADAGADVLADDVFYLEEPFFQDGPVAVAVREVVEEGKAYFSAAGNDNLIDEGYDIASWETPEYRDAGSCPPAVQAVPGAKAFHCLDFNPGSGVDKTFGIKLEAGETLALDLQWDEPRFGVETDLDAFLLDANGGRIAESGEDNVGVSQAPVEIVEWTNPSSSTRTVQLVVNRFTDADSTPRVKFALIQNGGGVAATEYPRSSGEDVVGPTIFGHSGSASAISVGAARFSTKSFPEPYSSRGPVLHDFGPVEGTSPAPPIAPEVLSKPDLLATDCGRTTFFSFFGLLSSVEGWHFCGTSAAAPHAAAVAALMLDAEPAAEPDDLRSALYGSAVASTFNPQYGPCDIGAGLVEAVGAVEAALDKTGGPGPVCEPPGSEVDPEEAAAPGDWGSEVPPVVKSGTKPPSTTAPTTEPPPVTPIPPNTFFRRHPNRVIRTPHRQARAVFRFGSNEAAASFVCRIDGGFFRPCPERLVRRFALGWHAVEVAALNPDGDGDRSPARYRFKVKRVR